MTTPTPSGTRTRRWSSGHPVWRSCTTSGSRTVVDLTVPGLGRDVAPRGPGRGPGPGEPGGGDRLVHRRRPAAVLPDARSGPAGRRPGPAGRDVPPGRDGGHRRVSGVRAGMLKVVTDTPGLTPTSSGCWRPRPLVPARPASPSPPTATRSCATGSTRRRSCSSRGVPADHVVIGHSGDSEDLDYLLRCSTPASPSGWTGSGWPTPAPTRRGWPPCSTCWSAGTPSSWCSPTTAPTSAGSPRRRGGASTPRTGPTTTSADASSRRCLERGAPQEDLDTMMISQRRRRLLAPGRDRRAAHDRLATGSLCSATASGRRCPRRCTCARPRLLGLDYPTRSST